MRTSAAELPELGFTIRWAIESGALRKQHGKVLATATWLKLDAKPLERWLKAAAAVVALGPLATFHAGARYRGGGDEILDLFAPDIVQGLSSGPQPFDSVLDVVFAGADEVYTFGGYMADPESRRRSIGWDLARFVRILGWAGVAERVDAVEEPDRWDPGRTVLTGGTLQLTPLGTWWLAVGGPSA